MPALAALVINLMRIMLMAKLGAIVVKLLLFFGLEFVTTKYAMGPALDALKAFVQTGPGTGLGATVMQWAGVMRLDQALSCLFSAFTTAATIKGAKVALGLAGT